MDLYKLRNEVELVTHARVKIRTTPCLGDVINVNCIAIKIQSADSFDANKCLIKYEPDQD